MKVYLIQHGQTDWNIKGKLQGTTNIPLNSVGIAQASMVAYRINNCDISAVYTSGLTRARQTATIISRTIGVDFTVVPNLREQDFGDYSGYTINEVYDTWGHKYPECVLRPLNGEHWSVLRNRSVTSFDNILSSHFNDESIVVVSHGGVLSSIVANILDIPRPPYNFQLSGNTCVSIIENGRLTLLNDLSHLT